MKHKRNIEAGSGKIESKNLFYIVAPLCPLYEHPPSVPLQPAIYNPSPSPSSSGSHALINSRNPLILFGFKDFAYHILRFFFFFLMTHSKFHIFCMWLGCRLIVDCFSWFSPSHFMCSSSCNLKSSTDLCFSDLNRLMVSVSF